MLSCAPPTQLRGVPGRWEVPRVCLVFPDMGLWTGVGKRNDRSHMAQGCRKGQAQLPTGPCL